MNLTPVKFFFSAAIFFMALFFHITTEVCRAASRPSADMISDVSNANSMRSPSGSSISAGSSSFQGSARPTSAMRGYEGGVPQTEPLYPQQRLPSAASSPQQYGSQGMQSVAPGMQPQQYGMQSAPLAAPPAWAQQYYPAPATTGLLPFGANLFIGNFSATYHSGLQPQYAIMPGDRIMVRIWGAFTYDDVLVVDQQGNIFIPEVGPVVVGGLRQSSLQSSVQAQVASVFTSNIGIYTNLMNTQPVAVFVTGNVLRPGRYAGGPADSILYYLDRAGGIIPERGSYRQVAIKRGKRTIAHADLYDFLVRGDLPEIRLQDGDVILVRDRGAGVAALGLIRQPARYEFFSKRLNGGQLMSMAQPMPGASHVSITGTRDGTAFNDYISIEQFTAFPLRDEDIIEFHADRPGKTIMAGATGAIIGASRFPVLKGTTLRQLLKYVAVDPNLADTGAIYIRRRSVAEQQKKTIADSLRRLEQSALTAKSSSVDEANIRVREAELIQDFVKRANLIQPDGVVVVAHNGTVNDLILEEGDIVYVPQKSDVVQVTGEVTIPKAVVYSKQMRLVDYVKSAGGFSERADKKNVLVVKPNGEVARASDAGIGPGDQIMVMPEYDAKAVQSTKDIMQVIYQLAVSAGVVLRFMLW